MANAGGRSDCPSSGPDGPGRARRRVTGLAVDSRAVRAGFLFAALPGSARAWRATSSPTALAQGRGGDPDRCRRARGSRPRRWPTPGVALVVAEDPRAALACAAALWFGAQPETMVAVTGTNGKTSVATFTRQIWTALGHAGDQHRHHGRRGRLGRPLSPHHARPDHAAPPAGGGRRGGVDPCGDGGVLATGSTSAGWTGCG